MGVATQNDLAPLRALLEDILDPNSPNSPNNPNNQQKEGNNTNTILTDKDKSKDKTTLSQPLTTPVSSTAADKNKINPKSTDSDPVILDNNDDKKSGKNNFKKKTKKDKDKKDKKDKNKNKTQNEMIILELESSVNTLNKDKKILTNEIYQLRLENAANLSEYQTELKPLMLRLGLQNGQIRELKELVQKYEVAQTQAQGDIKARYGYTYIYIYSFMFLCISICPYLTNPCYPW